MPAPNAAIAVGQAWIPSQRAGRHGPRSSGGLTLGAWNRAGDVVIVDSRGRGPARLDRAGHLPYLFDQPITPPCGRSACKTAITGRAYLFCAWVRSTVPPSTSRSSVASLVRSLPDMSR